MKFLILIFLFGLAAANYHDALDKARDDVLLAFMEGMENARSLREVMNMPYAEELDEVEDDTKTELVKSLKDTLDHILQKIKDAIEHGKVIKGDLFTKANEIADKLKDMHVDVGDRLKNLYQKLKEKSKDWFKKLLERYGLGKRAVHQSYEVALSDFDLHTLLKRFRQKLLDTVDSGKIEEYIDKIFGPDTMTAKTLKKALEKGREHLKKLVNMLLKIGENNNKREDRSLKDLYDRVLDALDVHLNLKEKFSAFLEWLKETYDAGVEVAKDKVAFIKDLAREFIKHAKESSKRVADEALEFFRPYKHDLGELWDELKEAVKEVSHHE